MNGRLPEGEDQLLAWLRRRADPEGLYLGHDTARLPEPGPRVVTVDTQIAGTHVPEDLDPAVAARRLLAVNLSDLAAAGALPTHALLALAAPPDFEHRRFLEAFTRACRRYEVQLAGGDLARCERWTAVLTLLGRIPQGGRWLRRDLARPGDRLWVGGTLGEAAAGLALVLEGARLVGRRVELGPHPELPPRLRAAARRAVRRQLAPRPQLELGEWLGRQERAAVLDLSDGLSRDLHRLCRASSVGAEIEASSLPLAPQATELAEQVGCEAQELAVFGGEDYVLLFALPSELTPPDRFGCRTIGSVTEAKGVQLRTAAGRPQPLPDRGWDHLRPTSPTSGR